jgi:hypothetical protein
MSTPIPIHMRAAISFQVAGRPVTRGEQFWAAPAEAVAMVQSGHAVPVHRADQELLAEATGVHLQTRRIRGVIGQRR